jgi:hypothetical protein
MKGFEPECKIPKLGLIDLEIGYKTVWVIVAPTNLYIIQDARFQAM